MNFYSMPDELKVFLHKMFEEHECWLVAYFPSKKECDQIAAVSEIDNLSFEAESEDEIIFFLGKEELGPVVWEDESRRRINFIASRAIQLVPSLIVERKILLEGRMAIMRKQEYAAKNIDLSVITKFYSTTKKELEKLMYKNFSLVQKVQDKTVKHNVGRLRGRC